MNIVQNISDKIMAVERVSMPAQDVCLIILPLIINACVN